MDFSDFTEKAYREVLSVAKDFYAFERFGTGSDEPHVLWRHDVDVSVHRAARIAAIEEDHGVSSTYFFWFHSPFYNLLERPVLDAARGTLRRGHSLGLHFDSSFYGEIGSADELAEHVAREADRLGELMECSIEAVSFHNPGVREADRFFAADQIAGLVNAYGVGLAERYEYVSDSNGYWRFKRLRDVLEQRTANRLHVLTHPEWWQERAMPPRQRLLRCVEGRSEVVLREYDALLAAAGRENIG